MSVKKLERIAIFLQREFVVFVARSSEVIKFLLFLKNKHL